MKLHLIVAAAVLSVAAAPATPPVSRAITAALANPARADQQGDDARRQAAAVLAFAGVKPGDTVIDFLPGRYYWSRLFKDVVGSKGKVLAMWPASAADRAVKALPAEMAKWTFGNVTYVATPTNLPSVAQPADLFWTAQNYHDIPAAAIGAFNAAVFNTLKPGGIYLVIDHADARGSLPTVPFKHRIDSAVVKSQVIAAGFRFVGQSTVLANPADDHSKPVTDPAIRGNTDQFVFKFKKPG